MLRTIPALRACEIMRPGYAIEYDYLPGTQVFPSLETKLIRNLFLAGQIIGTTGYEEAGALGIMAGINAAQRARERESVILRRDQAYIGVLIDDLVTKEMDEPYRMHTSQAEFRLLLRQDNADERLSPIGHAVGLVGEDRYREVARRSRQVDEIVTGLSTVVLHPSERTNERVRAGGGEPLTQSLRADDFLSRPAARLSVLQDLELVPDDLTEDVVREAETRLRYATYVARQQADVERLRRVEARVIPEDIDYGAVSGLRSESREKLERVRPRTIGQASRIAGVTPSDVSMLLVTLERDRRQVAAR
jgi:tRNA uridine 5-carboxymethylaminomethyl modification enzyme